MTHTSFQVKKYVADDVASAFRMVKNELGQDAVILSNEQIDGKIHILAAPHENSAPAPDVKEAKPFQAHANQTASALLQLKKNKQQSRVVSQNAPDPLENTQRYDKFSDTVLTTKIVEAPSSVDEQVVNDLKSEIMSIRKMMSVTYASSNWEQFQQQNLNQSIIYKKLLSIGFEPATVDKLIQNIPESENFDEVWISVLNELVKNIKLFKEHWEDKKIHLTLGPSGSGKTTLLAKHLMQVINENNSQHFAIIFLNKNKLTTVHEANTFQNVFNVATYYVESPEELEKAFHMCQDKRQIFVDVPALDMIDEESNYFIDYFKEYQDDLALYYVLPANVEPYYLHEIDKYLEDFDISALSISKIDEHENYAPVINFALEKDIPIAYINLDSTLTEPLIEAQRVSIMKDLLIILNSHNLNQCAIDEKMANFLMEKISHDPEAEKESRQSA